MRLGGTTETAGVARQSNLKMRVEANGESAKNGGTPLLQPEGPGEQPCRARCCVLCDLRELARSFVVLPCPISDNRINAPPRRFKFRLSTTRPKSRPKLFKPGQGPCSGCVRALRSS